MKRWILNNRPNLGFALAILILLGILGTTQMGTQEAHENTTQTHGRRKFLG